MTSTMPEQYGATQDPKVQAIVAYQTAMAKGDLVTARAIFQPDVVYRVAGQNQLSGTFHGPEQVMGYLGKLMELTRGSYSISSMNWLVSGDGVALATVNHADRNGAHLDWNEVIVFHFVDGKKARIDLYSQDQAAVDAFFGT